MKRLFSTRIPWPEIIVLAIGALTRLWRLGYHSIWFDEAVSLKWAGTDPGYIWRVTFQLVEEKHPPVYYLALYYWRAFFDLIGFGRSDIAMRSLGALLGLLTVAGLMLLARRLSGRMAGLLAGLLVALAPVLVWYSQELRMFQPAATGLVWGGYCLIRGWQGERAWTRLGWWVGFVLSMSAALYSYLFAAFMLPAAGLTVFALAIVDWSSSANEHPRTIPWRRFAEGGIAVAATGLLFLPLAKNAWAVNEAEGDPGQAFQHLLENHRQLLQIFTVWRVDWPVPALSATLLLFALLVLVGFIAPYRNRAHTSYDRPFLLLWIGIPLLIGNVLLAKSASVFGEDRYFIFIAPFVLWAIARGVVAVGQRAKYVGIALGVAIVILPLIALPRLWTPATYRENWRAATDYVIDYELQSPEMRATLIAHVDYTRLPVQWYARPAIDDEQLPIYFPFAGALTPDQVEDQVAPPLQGIVDQGVDTLWLTQSHLDGVDDQRVVESWLSANFPLVTEQFPAGVKLSGYATEYRYDALPQLGDAAHYPAAEIAPGLTLAACEIMTPAISATDDAMHPPSGWVHVRLWWHATGAVDDDYVATVQMMGPEGVWGDRLYRGNEALRRAPTSTWNPGEIVRDEIDVNLNPITPDGVYPIVVGVMNGAGESTGDKVTCGEVIIR